MDFCRGAYEKSTLIRYDQDTKYWIEFINSNGLHKFLWGLSRQEKVIEMVRFIRELVVTSHRSGDQVTRILSAMASLFRTHCQDIASVMESDSVKLARKAAAKQESARAISERKEMKRRAPVTLSMLSEARVWYWKMEKRVITATELDQSMVYIALMLAFHFMWRASEYIFDSKCTKHAILNKDILFIDQAEGRFNREELRRTCGKVRVNKILFKLRSTKTQRYGNTRYLVLKRGSRTETGLLEDIVRWITSAGVAEPDMPFLSRNAAVSNKTVRLKKLTRKEVSDALKYIAGQKGYSNVGFAFSPHSLRIGGASTMVGKGGSTEDTRMIGGWSKDSEVAEIYWQYSPLEGGALSEYHHTLDVGDLPVTQFMVYDSREDFVGEHPGAAQWIKDDHYDTNV